MNWHFRSLKRTLRSDLHSEQHTETCEIEPLLSLYADGAASPEEVRQVEAHLLGCPGCGEMLSWTQATHHVLAARPVAVPPPGLQSRIAQAIAASSAAPISLRPSRTFALKPAYAAAASLTVAGLILSYPLWHSSAVAPVPHTVPRYTASVPTVKSLPTSLPHQFLHARKTQLSRPLMASNKHSATGPLSIKSVPVVQKTAPALIPLERVAQERVAQERVAEVVKTPVAIVSHPEAIISRIPVHHQPILQKVASHLVPPAETHLPVTAKEVPVLKLPAPQQVAKRTLPAVPVDILPPTVTSQAPTVKTASSSPPSGNILASVGEYAARMRSVALVAPQQLYRGPASAMNVMRSLSTEHTAYVDGIHLDDRRADER